MDRTLKRCGRFVLIETEEGFVWRLTSHAGRCWHWDPAAQQWTDCCHWSPTAEAATAGLDWTLSHEQAGHLDEEHLSPAAARSPHAGHGEGPADEMRPQH